ncbi:AraC family transcriptional regulator [Streptomyces sp. NPDC042319]|uniref:AraC family transcriptional regulator n=1 Tax=Streptomyces sp. NPDC042319 TaxID=3154332 RepID=UPI0033F5FC81
MMHSAAPHWLSEVNSSMQASTESQQVNLPTQVASSTYVVRLESVVTATRYMTAHLCEPLQLVDIARAGLLSPCHFHRVFREITSTTPAKFLTSLRMAEARRLLLTTSMNVTEICTEVGYSSLGTFISQFGRLAGVPPRQFRNVVTRLGDLRLDDLSAVADRSRAAGPVVAVTGESLGCDCTLVGMFAADRVHALPRAFEVTRTNVATRLGPLADGTYVAVAVGFGSGTTIRDALAAGASTFGIIGFHSDPVEVRDGNTTRPFLHVVLRRQRLIDPPIEFTLPLLRLAGAGVPGSRQRSPA